MLPPEQSERIHMPVDYNRLVANRGLLFTITLAHNLGLGELVSHHVDLRRAPGRDNSGDKLLTMVASALAISLMTPTAA